MSYLEDHGTRSTPQGAPIPGAGQVENRSGGHAWEATPWERLHRFLILGAESGTFYVGQRKLATENVECVRACIAENGTKAVLEAVAVSVAGRAPSNDPALFVLACAISAGDPMAKRAAAAALLEVARTGTHLYQFVAYAKTMRGWGRTMRYAVSQWYERNPNDVAYQAIKYRQRDGWTHRDLLRLAHPNPADRSAWDGLAEFITHPEHEGYDAPTPRMVDAFRAAQLAVTPARSAELIRKHRLPREAIKPEHLNDLDVWHALLEVGMPMHALVRNLATMTRNGVLTGAHLELVLERLEDQEAITGSRLHPMALLIALATYASGQSDRGDSTWLPLPAVIDALDKAFYLAFGNVEPIGRPTLLTIDVSASMHHGSVAGARHLSPVMAAGALAMIHVATERDLQVIGVDGRVHSLGISARQRLDDVVSMLESFRGGRTDMALPYLLAADATLGAWKPEAFVTLTDNESWAGAIHPSQAFRRYRESTGLHSARAVTVAMTADRYTLADPRDGAMLDVAGMDSSAPAMASAFAANRL